MENKWDETYNFPCLLPGGSFQAAEQRRCEELTHLKRLWCWERLTVWGEEDDRGWDGWMTSQTQWTWVWATLRNSEGQGILACCSPWHRKESGTTERLNWTELNREGKPNKSLMVPLSGRDRDKSLEKPKGQEFIGQSNREKRGAQRELWRSAESAVWVLSSTCVWGNYQRKNHTKCLGKQCSVLVQRWEKLVFPQGRVDNL